MPSPVPGARIALGALGIAALPPDCSTSDSCSRNSPSAAAVMWLRTRTSLKACAALIAVGSGGWLGRGWGLGSQNQLHFLRVRHTDFIFSVIAEEFGLIGAAFVAFLSFYVVWRLLRIADMARDQFGRLIAIGVAAIVFFQVFVNIGFNLSIPLMAAVSQNRSAGQGHSDGSSRSVQDGYSHGWGNSHQVGQAHSEGTAVTDARSESWGESTSVTLPVSTSNIWTLWRPPR